MSGDVTKSCWNCVDFYKGCLSVGGRRLKDEKCKKNVRTAVSGVLPSHDACGEHEAPDARDRLCARILFWLEVLSKPAAWVGAIAAVIVGVQSCSMDSMERRINKLRTDHDQLQRQVDRSAAATTRNADP